jgi:hypothetical protein
MKKRQRKDVLLLSYRPISGYSSQTYETKSGDRLIVLAGKDKPSEEESGHHAEARMYLQAEGAMEKIRRDAITQLKDQTLDRVIIYSGLYAQRESLQFAGYVKEKFGITPELVVCDCDLAKKRRFADDIGARLRVSECGGRVTMGEIADYILST